MNLKPVNISAVRSIFMKFFTVTILAFTLFFAPFSQAQKVFYSIEKIKAMPLEQLEVIWFEMQKSIDAIKLSYESKDNWYARDLEAIENLAKYQISDVQEVLTERLNSELQRLAISETLATADIIEACLESLAKVASKEAVPALSQSYIAAQHLLRGNKVILDMFTTVISMAQKRSYDQTSFDKILEKAAESSGTAKSKLEKMRKVLESKIMGQPEVIEALLNMEWRSMLFGERNKPELIYLMGLPGTGKDTAAEAFAEAKANSNKATQHLFRMPLMRSKPDEWKVFGSATGYVGSDAFPPFLDFLVLHSGGRYKTEKAGGSFRIVENPEWKPGKVLPGYYSPDTAVVFINEFHNWSKGMKDRVLKQALEKGYFSINDPKGGVAEIYVPVTFVIASNEGIPEMTSRETNGTRSGKPLNYEELLKKWEALHKNKTALKAAILSTNRSQQMVSGEDGQSGISEEVLNRVPDKNILLLRPLSPMDLRKIVEIKLNEFKKSLSGKSALFDGIEITWAPELVQFIQEFQYMAEENSRPVASRVTGLVEDTLLEALRGGQILSENQKIAIHLSFAKNEDGTSNLVMKIQEGTSSYTISRLMTATEIQKIRPPVSDTRIEQLADLASRIKKRVFGVDGIADRVAERILAIENSIGNNPEPPARPVNTLALFGLSSTGKTQLAKTLAKELLGSEAELMVIDFSQVQTLNDFKAKVLGYKDATGQSYASDFMKLYDRNNGRVLVAFDELANVKDPDLLRSLYDLFREGTMSTFSDGKSRNMGAVTIVVTGNAGKELYANVPRNIPMEQQMEAWQEIARETESDSALKASILEKYFPSPLLARFGKNNIFFMPPHSYKSAKELAQLTLLQALEELAVENNKRGWKVEFASQKEYVDFVEMIVNEGFSILEQGASLDSFVKQDVISKLEYLLLSNKIPSGAKVQISFIGKTENNDAKKPGFMNYRLKIDGQKDLELKIARPYIEKPKAGTAAIKRFTGYHEAGHELMRKSAFADKFTSERISIIPGVSMIGGSWVHYLGIASYTENEEINPTREWVIRQIAVFAAGETAERLVSVGEVHSAGKSNDMERATRLAEVAVLKYGLSEAWGTHSIPPDLTIAQYKAGLSEKQRRLLETEVQVLVNQGREMAREYLTHNFDVLVELGNQLLEQGEMNKADLEKFYESRSVVMVGARVEKSKLAGMWSWMKSKVSSTPAASLDGNIRSDIPAPRTIADIDQIVAQRKAEQFAQVEASDKAPISKVAKAISESTVAGSSQKSTTLTLKKSDLMCHQIF